MRALVEFLAEEAGVFRVAKSDRQRFEQADLLRIGLMERTRVRQRVACPGDIAGLEGAPREQRIHRRKGPSDRDRRPYGVDGAAAIARIEAEACEFEQQDVVAGRV